MSDDSWELLRDPNTIVFLAGHRIDCEDRYSCSCDDEYVALFNRCPECGAELDKWGECPDEQDHW